MSSTAKRHLDASAFGTREAHALAEAASVSAAPTRTSPFLCLAGDVRFGIAEGNGRPLIDHGLAGRFCLVDRAQARLIDRNPTAVIRAGDWPGEIEGRADHWGVWCAIGLVWLLSSDVRDAGHAAELINDFMAAAEETDQAEVRGDPFSRPVRVQRR